MGKRKQHQILVGFAAETSDVIQNARQKMQKEPDLLVANDLTVEGSGLCGDTNIVTILFKDGREKKLPLMSKREVARIILDSVLELS